MSDKSNLREFAEKGFLELPNLIGLRTIVDINRAINSDINENPFMWNRFDGTTVNRNAILSIPGVSTIILNPGVRKIVDEIFSGQARFEEAVVMLHDSSDTVCETDWHRDIPHNANNAYGVEYVQLLVYLSNVTAATPKFSIFPESIDDQVVPQSELMTLKDPIDFEGLPGSAILFNSSSFHGVRKTLGGSRSRSLHIYYGDKDRPCASEFTIIPDKLVHTLQEKDMDLFDKRNRLSALIFG